MVSNHADDWKNIDLKFPSKNKKQLSPVCEDFIHTNSLNKKKSYQIMKESPDSWNLKPFGEDMDIVICNHNTCI